MSVFPVLCQYSLDLCKLGCVETASVQFRYLHLGFVPVQIGPVQFWTLYGLDWISASFCTGTVRNCVTLVSIQYKSALIFCQNIFDLCKLYRYSLDPYWSCLRYSFDLRNLYAVIFGSVQVWCQLLDSLDLCKVLPLRVGSVHFLFQYSLNRLVSVVLVWFGSLQVLHC